MKIPKRTGEIFELLSKGNFISSNSADARMRQLYDIIESEGNFEALQDYFHKIHFVLEKGNEFFYFSRQEQRTDIERKLESAMKWIDIVDFFKAYEPHFGVGYSFYISNIVSQVSVDATLKSKIESLRKNKQESYDDCVARLVKTLCDDSFAELENEISKSYKILAAFKYIEDLIQMINIPEEVQNEIPE